jgi:hypothetical protein
MQKWHKKCTVREQKSYTNIILIGTKDTFVPVHGMNAYGGVEL